MYEISAKLRNMDREIIQDVFSKCRFSVVNDRRHLLVNSWIFDDMKAVFTVTAERGDTYEEAFATRDLALVGALLSLHRRHLPDAVYEI
jgi:hypothetical protein